MKYGLSKAAIEKICSVFARFGAIEKAVLYGSRAKGNFKTGSDIDLTLYGEALTSDVCSTIASALDDQLLPYTIDLSVFEDLNHVKLREHIERVGVIFYERNSAADHPGTSMKSGWIRHRLSEITTKIGSGATPLGGEANYKQSGISLIRSLNVHDGEFRLKDLAFIDEAQAKQLDNVVVEAGDVLLNITGASVARCCVVPKEVLPARVNQHVSILRPIANELSPRFLQYMLVSRDYKNQLLSAGDGGATRQALTKAQLQDFSIQFPKSLAEQQRIVGILDEAFEGIATAKANAEKNLQNARALFESHLQSVFTQRGEGWVQKTLEEIATTFGRGKSRHRPRNAPHLYGGPYPFVQTGDIRNADHVITEYSQTYNEAGLAQSRLWPKGTICITIAANIAETAILGFDACFPDSVIGVVANQKQADVGFIEYLLQSFKARLQAMGKGSAQANINMGTFENERFPFPTVAEQKTIVAKLDGLSEETQTLATIYERKLAALDDLKKSLLHQAFSGEL